MLNENIRKTIGALRDLLEREAISLRTRNYETLAAIQNRKEQLAAAAERALSGIAGESNPDSLIASLNALNVKAKENAALMELIRQAFADARKRLEAVAEIEKRTGLYAAGGRDIRASSAISADRSV